MRRLIGGGLAALAIGLIMAPVAQADIDCTTSRYSGMSFTICRYSDPWQPATTTTCYDNSGRCTTTGGYQDLTEAKRVSADKENRKKIP